METLEGVGIGTICSHSVKRQTGVFHYGLGIVTPFQRQGFGGEAVVLFLRYFFGELGYHKCQAGVYSFNQASIRFHEKLGFSMEGRLRETIFSHGQRFDELIFGITASEFYGKLLPQYEETLPYRY